MSATRLAVHQLSVAKLERSLDFYCSCLGMVEREAPANTGSQRGQRHARCFLGFERNDKGAPEGQGPDALLELVHSPRAATHPRSADDALPLGYWKIGIALADVDRARAALVARGVEVTSAQQFADIGYLCHLKDPDGYSIELIQHTFGPRVVPSVVAEDQALGVQPTLAHITLRVADAARSLAFYTEQLGMHLVARQDVRTHGFSLYFLACQTELPPVDDWADRRHREWLWQRPYSLLELQHVWHPERACARYATGPDTGFLGLVLQHAAQRDPTDLVDPDGYRVRLVPAAGTAV
ncbi:MAG: VOC family protein [Pseudomonadota bacterium]